MFSVLFLSSLFIWGWVPMQKMNAYGINTIFIYFFHIRKEIWDTFGKKGWNMGIIFSRVYILKQELVCSIIFTEQNCH